MCSGSGGNESVPIVRSAAATMSSSVLSVSGNSSMLVWLFFCYRERGDWWWSGVNPSDFSKSFVFWFCQVVVRWLYLYRPTFGARFPMRLFSSIHIWVVYILNE